MLRLTWLAIALLTALPPFAFGQQITGNPPKDLRAAEDQLREALVKADTATLSKLLTDDYLRTPPTLPNTTKSQYFEVLRSGKLKYFSIDTKEATYRTYGDTAIVNSVTAFRVLVNGQQRDEVLRILSVWVKQNGQWRLAAVQGNPTPTE
ncbi:MAG TPA: nuclear transport factor 2 family protein [Candidatus Acidoferrales bacterium]|nr:nuclear transport factor 2 family protein [Candidatus Acidoferrales bacterium]